MINETHVLSWSQETKPTPRSRKVVGGSEDVNSICAGFATSEGDTETESFCSLAIKKVLNLRLYLRISCKRDTGFAWLNFQLDRLPKSSKV